MALALESIAKKFATFRNEGKRVNRIKIGSRNLALFRADFNSDKRNYFY